MFVGHDWGALIVWDLARLHPERVRAVVGVSVPFVQWPAPPTQLMKMMYGDRFFYILYFQQVGAAEAELDADAYDYDGQGAVGRQRRRVRGATRPAELPPMEGTGFLTMMPRAAAAAVRRPGGTVARPRPTCRPTPTSSPTAGFFGPSATTATSTPTSRSSRTSARAVDDAELLHRRHRRRRQRDGPDGRRADADLLPDFRGATILDGVGHWTQQEAPAAFNDALLGFLRTL